MATQLLIFAKTPLPGAVKTRLIPALGAQGAADIATRMLHYTLDWALELERHHTEVRVRLWVAPDPGHLFWLNIAREHPQVCLHEQRGVDLGARMKNAAREVTAQGDCVLLIGTDCLQLNGPLVKQAIQALQDHDAVIAPTRDGGYALLGLRKLHSRVFDDIPWSTEQVFDITCAHFAALGWDVHCLPQLQDIDEPTDLALLPQSWL